MRERDKNNLSLIFLSLVLENVKNVHQGLTT